MTTPLELIDFWSRQLSEHALFFSLGLETPDLKEGAGFIHGRWEEFRARIPNKASESKLDDLIDELQPLAQELREFKVYLYERLAAGQWHGWIFPTFVDHTRRELDYFMGLLLGKPEMTKARAAEELCSWLRFMGEHAAFASSLLDPEEKALVNEAREITDELGDLQSGCGSFRDDFVKLSEHAGKALDAYFSKKIDPTKLLSVIHPVLAVHVVREGRMFLKRIAELRGVESAVKIPE